MPLRLNLGCGKRKLDGWVNVDSNPRHEPDLVLDLEADPWPWDRMSVDEIAAYHLIEHLPKLCADELLRKCWRVLRPGGRIVIECPDLAALCALYATRPVAATRSIYGHQTRGDAMRHRYGYSRETLAAALKVAGFHVVHVGDGEDYHAAEEPCIRVVGVKP